MARLSWVKQYYDTQPDYTFYDFEVIDLENYNGLLLALEIKDICDIITQSRKFVKADMENAGSL